MAVDFFLGGMGFACLLSSTKLISLYLPAWLAVIFTNVLDWQRGCGLPALQGSAVEPQLFKLFTISRCWMPCYPRAFLLYVL